MEVPDLTDEQAFQDAVLAELRGEADADTCVALQSREHVRAWLNELLRLKQDVEVQLIERDAKAKHHKQGCLERGNAGKTDWFAYEADLQTWRASVMRFKVRVEQGIRLVKERVRLYEDGDRLALERRLRSIEDRLAALEGQGRSKEEIYEEVQRLLSRYKGV
jgi:hypothetical protein